MKSLIFLDPLETRPSEMDRPKASTQGAEDTKEDTESTPHEAEKECAHCVDRREVDERGDGGDDQR